MHLSLSHFILHRTHGAKLKMHCTRFGEKKYTFWRPVSKVPTNLDSGEPTSVFTTKFAGAVPTRFLRIWKWYFGVYSGVLLYLY